MLNTTKKILLSCAYAKALLKAVAVKAFVAKKFNDGFASTAFRLDYMTKFPFYVYQLRVHQMMPFWSFGHDIASDLLNLESQDLA